MPAIAARAQPIANVKLIVVSTLIPINFAAPSSSETARIALPIVVLFTNNVNKIINNTDTLNVI